MGWFSELGQPGHYGLGDFAFDINTGAINSRFEYALMSVTEIAQAPGNDKVSSSPFPDPEFTPQAGALADVQSAESRRLRATFALAVQLESEHSATVPAIYCSDPFHLGFDAVWAQYRCLVGCDPSSRWQWWQHPDPVELVKNDLTIGGLVLVHPEQGIDSSVRVDALALETLGAAPVLSTLLPASSDSTAPGLLVLSQGIRSTPWVRLVEGAGPSRAGAVATIPTDSAPPETRYSSVAAGELPVTLVAGSRLVSDPMTGRAALFVPGSSVWGYDPDLLAWRNAGAPAEVLSRNETALELVGPALVVAGGVSPDGAVLADAWAVHVLGGGAQRVATSLPPRRSALLAVRADSSGFVYAGGYDDAGVARDEVWELSRQGGGALAPRLLRAETGRGTPLTSTTAGLDLAETAGTVGLFRLDPSRPAGVIREQRTSSGWSEIGLDGVLRPRCWVDDAHGGEACSLAAPWWSNAGTLSCQTEPLPGVCTGAHGDLIATATLAGTAQPTALASDEGALWVVRGKLLERWDVSVPGIPTLSGHAMLPTAGVTIAGGGGAVLVGTENGVLSAAFTGSGLALSPKASLCGRPLAAARVGDGTWAVVSKDGLTTVAASPGQTPKILARAVLTIAPDGTTQANLEPDCSGNEDGIDDNAAILIGDHGRALVVLKKAIVEVNLTNPSAPTGGRSLLLDGRINALRLDSLEGRAYGAGNDYRPVVDLRGPALQLSGKHVLEDWVRRSDSALADGTRTSARLDQHHVVVAWVVP